MLNIFSELPEFDSTSHLMQHIKNKTLGNNLEGLIILKHCYGFILFFARTVLCFWFLLWVESVYTSMGQGVEGGWPLILHLCFSPVQRGKQSKQPLTGTRQSDSPPLH